MLSQLGSPEAEEGHAKTILDDGTMSIGVGWPSAQQYAWPH